MTWHRDDSHTREAATERQRDRATRARTPAPAGHARNGQAAASLPHKADAYAAHNREHEGYLIKELQQRLRTQIEARIRAKGLLLSFPHSAVLMTLHEEPGLSGAQLARRNSVTAQTMNGFLMPLESQGLIERIPDPENARILKCYLKPKGVEHLSRGMHEAGAVFDQMLSHLSEKERDAFRRILRRCIEALQARGGADTGIESSAASCLSARKQSDTRAKSKARRLRSSVPARGTR